MKKVLCTLLLAFPLLPAAVTAAQAAAGSVPSLRSDHAAVTVIRTQHGSGAFSWNRLAASFPFRYGSVAVSGGGATLLSGFSGATAVSAYRYAGAALEAGAPGLCMLGLRAAVADWEVDWLRFRLPNTELKESHIINRFYSAGASCALPVLGTRYDGTWYWGRVSLGLHDLGPFIAQPSIAGVASIHRFRLTRWYEGSIASFKLQGQLTNKNGEPIASGSARAFAFQNTVYISVAQHSELSLSASYLFFSGLFSVRLTAENQGYFLFPYRFYNRDVQLSGSAVGFGGSYRYTAGRFRFYGAAQLYSVIRDTGSDQLHSKEKKSFLFKGREERSSTPLPVITGTSLLVLRMLLSVDLTPYTELSAGRIIPVPLPSPQLAKQLDTLRSGSTEQPALIIDPLVTGLSVQLMVRL